MVSSSVIGPPGIRSTLTIFVWPTRAHSVRIWRIVASFATIDTRPLCIVTCTSAEAVDAATSQVAIPKSTAFMVKTQYTPFSHDPAGPLLLPEVVDHLRQDGVELMLWLIRDQRLHARQVGHAPRHVLES